MDMCLCTNDSYVQYNGTARDINTAAAQPTNLRSGGLPHTVCAALDAMLADAAFAPLETQQVASRPRQPRSDSRRPIASRQRPLVIARLGGQGIPHLATEIDERAVVGTGDDVRRLRPQARELADAVRGTGDGGAADSQTQPHTARNAEVLHVRRVERGVHSGRTAGRACMPSAERAEERVGGRAAYLPVLCSWPS